MEIRYPNYYRKFQCIAGDCPDTCCAGWEIAVDRKSERRYQQAQKTVKNRAFAQKLKRHVKHGRIISEDVTCPFLNDDGLCEMYIELGPESLCHTCARHPRHMEDYGNLHEVVLLMSCPEAARLILEENDGTFYVRNMPEKSGNMDGIDREFLQVLLPMRDLIWKIGMDAEVSLDSGMAFALALGHDVQKRIADGDYDGAGDVLRRYGKHGAVSRFVHQWKKNDMSRFVLMMDFMEEFSNLETICLDWPEMLERCRSQLYHGKNSRQEYGKIRQEFLAGKNDWCSGWARVFQYFVYSFMLGALYDGDVLTKIKMAVLCTMAIAELDLARWSEDGVKNFGDAGAEAWMADQAIDRRKNCYALARQIENSDENRKTLEQVLNLEIFRARRIVDALLE